MRRALVLTSIIVALSGLALPALAAEDLSGVWEIDSLRGDRRVEIWQDGNQLTVYRVLWPEFEGEKYKLEHIFKLKISDGSLSGKMYVREEGMKTFEMLRSIDGSIESGQKMLLDGMPVLRQEEKLEAQPPELAPNKGRARGQDKVSCAGAIQTFDRSRREQEVI